MVARPGYCRIAGELRSGAKAAGNRKALGFPRAFFVLISYQHAESKACKTLYSSDHSAFLIEKAPRICAAV